ncbi:MAG: LptA/OstA family protein [Armatimonadota bacterium]
MKKILLTLFIITMICSAVLAAPDEIKLNCDSFQVDDIKKELVLKNCRIEGNGIIITAPFARYNTKTQTGNFTGGVHVINKDTVIDADRMQLFYLKKEIILEGGVKLVTTKVNEKKIKEKYTLKCAQLDYFWEKEEGIATGNVHIIQKMAEAFCDKVNYSRGKNAAHLIGNVRFMKKSGDYIKADEAWVDLNNETFLAQRDVEGRFFIPGKKKEKKPAEETPQIKEIEIKPEPKTAE